MHNTPQINTLFTIYYFSLSQWWVIGDVLIFSLKVAIKLTCEFGLFQNAFFGIGLPLSDS